MKDQPTRALAVRGIAGPVGQGAIETVGRDGKMYRIRRKLHRRIPPQRVGRRHVSRDDDIRGADQRRERVLVVNDDRPFVPVCIGVHHAALDAGTIVQEWRLRAERMAMRGLRQYHVGAEVAEQARGESAGQSVGEVHNANSIECCRHVRGDSGRDAIGVANYASSGTEIASRATLDMGNSRVGRLEWVTCWKELSIRITRRSHRHCGGRSPGPVRAGQPCACTTGDAASSTCGAAPGTLKATPGAKTPSACPSPPPRAWRRRCCISW